MLRHINFFPKKCNFAHILHVTDNEGTPFFFDAVKRSQLVRCHPDTGLHFQKTSGTPYFIFGGDATDRGRYDLATTEMLVDFKKRHPENVFLLAGNREIKNNRFKIELYAPLIRERLLHGKSPRWLPNQTSLRDYVILDMLSHGFVTMDEPLIQNYVRSLSIERCQLLYLRWMLDKNMGCPNTFRYRAEELQSRLRKETIADEEVLQSFLQETAPDGLMGEYLKHSQIGVIIPESRVLAVHGGLTAFNVGRIPGVEKPIADARVWIQKFNAWYQKQIQEWCDYEPALLTEPAFTELDGSVLPIPNKPKYVVTADMLSDDRQFAQVPAAVSDYLSANDISIILTGHQPCGDHPALLRGEGDRQLFINGDTGYADFDPARPDDTRGAACHVLEIMSDARHAQISLQATLANGISVETNLKILPDKIVGDPYIGKLLQDGSLVQCRLANGDYRLASQKGFSVSYSCVNDASLAEMFERPSQQATMPKP